MLELKNISKSFGDKVILNNLNLEVKDGEILCIVGQSGGGKTTLLRCISGLEKIDGGQILIDGQVFDPYTNENNDSVIGVVFQEYNLFPHLTVLQNVTLAPTMVLKKKKEIAENEAKNLLNGLALEGKEGLYPFQLSGGQKQRVAIARALAMKPQILCYDEPTSALDPGLTATVKDIILNLKKEGMTQIIVTHDMDFAEEIADNILKVKPLGY
ncbi:amino acid ABC transporter ATP-binding protein [Ligilactobacillus salivarius]|uniref:Polar amino acid ABC transporter ATP-binding protein n=1 Tax=Ligilactobacillus salivarius TaxID=1624 RepID=A0A1V9U0I8_9LACO|nr:amino acid ABC transporter ATP-binding protein [Ligilactobacillus salivarius]EFK79676.1 ABC transporter, ATP-binding protein [Ligilactobacillus salivarius ACS-116-V-Col5a]MBS5940608.1 amino acid ABC transporter ATP-binding protein [Ligilactobacillus salivarius]MDE1506025.1 amino acid ABC transporter ATP-binding protein [Ligilactobacillus salivarius]MDE1520806.1 amino acid ABC transporter ATP-binding protein [Ligilactobacillus salivarius]OQR20748.1 polar amino acid ABC transporter ATP-bindin